MKSSFVLSWIAILISIFVVACCAGYLFSLRARAAFRRISKKLHGRLSLSRAPHNPILQPGTYPWQSEAAFNPAAIIINGRTHLLYRSVGADGVSRFGYASSGDGLLIDEHIPYPAYVSTNPRNVLAPRKLYSPVLYPSGGSWGGAEDPRMVAIDGRLYVTFNMFDGWDFIRTALISIPVEDFLNKDFSKFSAPALLSKPGQLHKNWSLFPEKIGGKFAILHSVSPRIEVEYRDSLEGIGTTQPFIESWNGARSSIPVRQGFWDNYVRSAGPPPLKTARGWLLFYHAHDRHEKDRYKLGAMLLDLRDPTKVLYRSRQPILEPDYHYENEGKPGVVYACGSTVNDGMLYVYYGGADRVVCVAYAPIEPFLNELMAEENATMATKHLAIQ
jgi:beta-1,2-mannobiose phosphorylase / 1,2-beta-oligomannan phosphorylase